MAYSCITSRINILPREEQNTNFTTEIKQKKHKEKINTNDLTSLFNINIFFVVIFAVYSVVIIFVFVLACAM